MKKSLYFLIICIGSTICSYAQQNNTSERVADIFVAHKTDWSSVKSLKELAKAIAQQTTDQEEQLRLLMLWMHNFITVDAEKYNVGDFRSSGISNIMQQKKAFGSDFSELTAAFCKELSIPCLTILGYARQYDYVPGTSFREPNHSWNLVKIRGAWYICDLFSSTQAIQRGGSFYSILDTRYFMPDPEAYNVYAVPMDPAFQLLQNPISMQSFTNAAFGSIDDREARLSSIDYLPYLEKTLKLSGNSRYIQEAKAGYAYNKANPNSLIIAYYNQGVELAQQKKATNEQLKQARTYLNKAKELLNTGNVLPQIQSLKDPCTKGIQYLNTIIK